LIVRFCFQSNERLHDRNNSTYITVSATCQSINTISGQNLNRIDWQLPVLYPNSRLGKPPRKVSVFVLM